MYIPTPALNMIPVRNFRHRSENAMRAFLGPILPTFDSKSLAKFIEFRLQDLGLRV